jgi:hypothetical protein
MSQIRDSGQSASTGAVEHGSRGIYIVGIRYQATTSEDKVRRLKACLPSTMQQYQDLKLNPFFF